MQERRGKVCRQRNEEKEVVKVLEDQGTTEEEEKCLWERGRRRKKRWTDKH